MGELINTLACVAGAWKYLGASKNGRARGRYAREEGAPARKAVENRFTPAT